MIAVADVSAIGAARRHGISHMRATTLRADARVSARQWLGVIAWSALCPKAIALLLVTRAVAKIGHVLTRIPEGAPLAFGGIRDLIIHADVVAIAENPVITGCPGGCGGPRGGTARRVAAELADRLFPVWKLLLKNKSIWPAP